jgi:hypothetical protein
MEIVNENNPQLTKAGLPKQKAGKKPGSKLYNDFQKMEAVKLWLACGSPTHVGAALGINRRTIHIWMNSDWWKRVVEEIKTEGRFVLSKKLRTLVDKSLDVLQDRIENGDFSFDRNTGEVIRRPISAKDAHKIASDFIDKGEKLEKPLQETNTATEDRLTQLADAFAKFASKTTRIEVIDARVIDKSPGNLNSEGDLNAVSIERKEGLLQGSSMGETSSRTKETTSTTNGSSESRREGGESTQGGQSPGGSYSSPESWRIQLPQQLESDSGP